MLDELGNVISEIEKQISDGIRSVLSGQETAAGKAGEAKSPFRFRIDSDGSLMLEGFVRGFTAARLVVPEGVVVISENAFTECQSITSAVFPKSLEVIEKKAFKGCKRLASVTFLSECAVVGENAFEDCVSLKKLIFPTKTFATLPCAFTNSGVRELRFPPETKLSFGTFIECGDLSTVTFMPAGSEGYDIMFGDFLFGSSGLTEITIPEGNADLGEAVFFKCGSLKKAIFTDGIREIPKQTFAFCSSLEEVVISGTIEKISAEAFVRCDSLRSVFIPDSVKFIESGAFIECGGLSSVRLPASVRLDERKNANNVMIYAFTRIADSGTFTVCGKNTSNASVFGFKRNISMDDMTRAIIGAVFEGDSAALRVVAASPEMFMRNILIGGNSVGAFDDIDRLLELISADKEKYYIPHDLMRIIDLPKTRERYLAGLKNTFYIDVLNIPEGITHISCGAFRGDKNIRRIVFPASLRYIGASAFAWCRDLESAELPLSLKTLCTNAFANCYSLKKVVINNGSCIFGTRVFSGCRALERITLPADMTAVPPEMFRKCASLEDAVMQNGLKSIGYRAFYGTKLTSVRIPDSVVEIGKGAFFRCKSLKKVIIPAGVISVGDDAFEYCHELERLSVTLNDELDLLYRYRSIAGKDTPLLKKVRINERSFDLTGKLDTYVFRGAVETLAKDGDGAARAAHKRLSPEYARLSELRGHEFFKLRTDTDIDMNELIVIDGLADGAVPELLHIPDGVTDIGSGAFYRCDRVKKLYIPDSVATIAADAFGECMIEEIYLPHGMKEIPANCFKNCRELRRAVIPKGTEIIGRAAFSGCGQLLPIVIPNSVRVIREEAFCGCSRMHYVKLPLCRLVGETDKRNAAFADCPLEFADIEDRVFLIDESFDMSAMCRIAAELLHEGNETARTFMTENGEYVFETFIEQDDIARTEQLLADFEGFSLMQIDRSIELALQKQQHEIYLLLLGYKREKLGFGDDSARFDL